MDETTRGDLEKILRGYRRYEEKVAKPEVLSGKWKPTSLEVLRKEIKAFEGLLYGLQRGVYNGGVQRIKHEGKVLVPGSGDGRRAALLNRLGYDVVAVEIEPEIVRTSSDMVKSLARQGIVDPNRIKILHGDFLDDNLYHSNGLRFEDFQKIYVYLTGSIFRNLLDKIEKTSPKGVELIALRHGEWVDPKINLKSLGNATIQVPNSLTYYELSMYRKT